MVCIGNCAIKNPGFLGGRMGRGEIFEKKEEKGKTKPVFMGLAPA